MSRSGGKRVGLASGEVHVWHADLDSHRDRIEMLAFLCSPDERRHAADMRCEERRARYVARKGLLRVLLGDYAQRTVRRHDALTSSAYAQGMALFALARTTRLGLGIAPVRPDATPPIGVLSAEDALWISRSGNRPRATALFVAAREACGRADHDVGDGSLSSALAPLEKQTGPVPIGSDGLVLQVVRDDVVLGCVVHDGPPLPCDIRTLGT